MGLSIHYNGQLKSPSLIPTITAEVEDICQSMDWEYQLFENTAAVSSDVLKNEPRHENGEILLKGIAFTPEGSEPIWLHFTTTGRLTSIVNFMILDGLSEEDLVYWVSTKTQYAGIDAHIAICSLLKYLKQKYFKTFDLEDEGYYWMTEDRATLQRRFEEYGAIIELAAGALENAETTLEERLDEDKLLDKLLKIIQKAKDEDKNKEK